MIFIIHHDGPKIASSIHSIHPRFFLMGASGGGRGRGWVMASRHGFPFSKETAFENKDAQFGNLESCLEEMETRPSS